MGYRVKRIKALEEENQKLREEKEYWNSEAICRAAELGEIKIKVAKAMDKLEVIKDRLEVPCEQDGNQRQSN